MTAFRNAVGHGRNAIGGSTVHFVTNTNDSGAGSLRAACVPGAIIIFQVAGDIVLQTPITLRGDLRMTFAFQTAPGGGVQLRCASGSTMIPLKFQDAQNFIIRGLRSRPGIFAEGGEIEGSYCIHLIGCEQFYIDHSSFSFSDDTAVQLRDTCKDGTIDNSIIAHAPIESLNMRGTTATIPPAERLSFLRTVIAHGRRRMPNINYAIASEMCNCVVQNYRQEGSRIAGGTQMDFRGNVLLPGLDTQPGALFLVEQPLPSMSLHIDDNQVIGTSGYTFMRGAEAYLSPTPVGSSGYEPMRSEDVLDYVTTHAGPFPTDMLDRRTLDDLTDGDGRWILHEREVGGHPVLTGIPRTQAQWEAFVTEHGGIEEAINSFYPEEIERFVQIRDPFAGHPYSLPVPILIHASLDAVSARVVIEREVLTLPFFVSPAFPGIKIAEMGWMPQTKKSRKATAVVTVTFTDGTTQTLDSVTFSILRPLDIAL